MKSQPWTTIMCNILICCLFQFTGSCNLTRWCFSPWLERERPVEELSTIKLHYSYYWLTNSGTTGTNSPESTIIKHAIKIIKTISVSWAENERSFSSMYNCHWQEKHTIHSNYISSGYLNLLITCFSFREKINK